MEKIRSEIFDKNSTSENSENSAEKLEIVEPQVVKKTSTNVNNIITAPEKIPDGYVKDNQGRLRKIV